MDCTFAKCLSYLFFSSHHVVQNLLLISVRCLCIGCWKSCTVPVHIWLCSLCVGLPHYPESLCAVMSEGGPLL